MEHCFVKNCDTDTNVVNSTTVFFIGFPIDENLKQAWISVLTFSNYQVIEDVPFNAKICSCHFDEKDFETHKTYGYKFLLPAAIPSIFPKIKNDQSPELEYFITEVREEIEESEEVVEDEEEGVEQIVQEEEDVTQFFGDGDLEQENVGVEFISFNDENAVQESEANNYDFNEVENEETDMIGCDPMENERIKFANFVHRETTGPISIEFENGNYFFLQNIETYDDKKTEAETNEEDYQPEPEPELKVVLQEEEEEEGEGDNEQDYEMIFNHDFQPEKAENEDSNTYFEEEITDIIEHGGGENDGDDLIEDESHGMVDNKKIEIVVMSRAGEKLPLENYIVEIINNEIDDGEIQSMKSEGETVEILDDAENMTHTCEKKKDNRFFCEYCNKGFIFASGLKKHLLVHTKEKPFECDLCGRGFTQKVNMDAHLRTHTGVQPDKKFTCDVCGKKCLRKSELLIHKNKHLKERPHACEICGLRFADITKFYGHLRGHKSELSREDYIDMIAQNGNAEIIIPDGPNDAAQSDAAKDECTVCGKLMRSEKALKKHKRKLHPKIFTCSYCFKQFLYQSMLDKHVRVHTLERPYKCCYCTSGFSQKINLEIHQRRHGIMRCSTTEYRFVCEVCDKAFVRKSALEIHTRMHTGEKPYKCDVCDKKFATTSSLIKHRSSHKDEYPYSCDYCEQAFKSSVKKKEHSRIHML